MELKSKKDRLSYSVGVQIAGNLLQSGFDQMNIDVLIKGLSDVIAKNELLIGEQEVLEIINENYEEFKNKAEGENEAAGVKFLEENKNNDGIVVLPSGLQYRILTEGEGEKAKPSDNVTTHYEGKTIDGRVFDSSFDRGEPATFPVNGVIAGWTEALQLMSVGSAFELFIPSNLAYGKQGAGAEIAPNSTLVFKVELLGIN